MGAWGTGLYSDDFALDVKSEFLDAINSGKPYREALKEMQIKKLPDLAALRKEYSSLNDRKSKLYEDYRQAKKQMQEYGVVKKNVDSILYPSQSKAKEQERG